MDPIAATEIVDQVEEELHDHGVEDSETVGQYLELPAKGTIGYPEDDSITAAFVIPETTVYRYATGKNPQTPLNRTFQKRRASRHEDLQSTVNGVKLLPQLEMFLQQTGKLQKQSKGPVKLKDAVGRKFSFL